MSIVSCTYCGMTGIHPDWCPNRPKPGVLVYKTGMRTNNCRDEFHCWTWTSGGTSDGPPDGMWCDCGKAQYVSDLGNRAAPVDTPA